MNTKEWVRLDYPPTFNLPIWNIPKGRNFERIKNRLTINSILLIIYLHKQHYALLWRCKARCINKLRKHYNTSTPSLHPDAVVLNIINISVKGTQDGETCQQKKIQELFSSEKIVRKMVSVITGHAKWYPPPNGLFPLSVATLDMDAAAKLFSVHGRK